MPKNLSDQSIEELQDSLHDLMEKRVQLREHASRITSELDGKVRRQIAVDRLNAMTDAQRKAIAQELAAAGITSKEAAGKVRR